MNPGGYRIPWLPDLVTYFKVGDGFGYELVTSLEVWESWEKSVPAHVAPREPTS